MRIMRNCPKCGSPVQDGMCFCSACGATMAVAAAAAQPKKKKGTLIAIWSAAVALVLVLALVVSWSFGLFDGIFGDGLFGSSTVRDNDDDDDDDPKTPAVTVPTGDTIVNYGSQVGDVCYNYELSQIYEAGSVTVEDYRGKITVINFWGTWCGPCKQELLTEFPLINRNYGDDVVVLTVHTSLGWSDSTPDDIMELFPNSSYVFVKDGTNEDFFQMLGGRSSWPMTVILAEDGVIVKTFFGTVKYDEAGTDEDLKGYIDGILAD